MLSTILGLLETIGSELSKKAIEKKIDTHKLQRIFFAAIDETIISSIERKNIVSDKDVNRIKIAMNQALTEERVYTNFEKYKDNLGFIIKDVFAHLDSYSVNELVDMHDITQFKDKLITAIKAALPKEYTSYLIDTINNQVIYISRELSEMNNTVSASAEMIGEIHQKIVASNTNVSSTPPKDLTLLPAEPVNMVGRQKELAELKAMLDQNNKVLLLNGMDGIGKTELCKRFLHAYYNKYDYVAWISCT